MCTYLQNLAKTFHSFYSNNKIADVNSPAISGQRYLLSFIVKQVLGNGLKLLGIEPIDKMERETVTI
jgi:arginyl-tRNA synthetase